MARLVVALAACAVGEIVDFPVEYADELSVDDFEARYVVPMRPVVTPRPPDGIAM